MQRYDIIKTISETALTSNIECGEFSYAQVLDRKVKGHFKLDIRFYDAETDTAVLVETKLHFVKNDKKQLFSYVELEREWSPSRKIIAILANTVESTIYDGDYCVFEWYTPGNAGSRDGKIVLAKDITEFDDNYSGRFTIKKYHRVSESLVELRSINAGHPTFTLVPNGEYENSNPILAVFVGTLKMKQ